MMRSVFAVVFAVLSVGALLAPASRAQAQPQAPIEVGLYPTVRLLTADVGPQSTWGVGATIAAAYHFNPYLAVEGSVLGSFVPQLNTFRQSQVNEGAPALSLVLQNSYTHALQPYVLGGIGYERYHFPPPLITGSQDLSYIAGHAGAGLRYRLGGFSALRLEANSQFGEHRPSWGFLTGVSFFVGPRGHSSAYAPMASSGARYRTDTLVVHVTDTVRVNNSFNTTYHTVDSIHTRDTVKVSVAPRVGDVILVLKDANFDFARWQLRPDARAVLDSLAGSLSGYSAQGIRIAIVGHTDAVGSDAYNERLGLARANEVRDYLETRGVALERMVTRSDGKQHPIADNKTAAGRQLNRRVVISRAS